MPWWRFWQAESVAEQLREKERQEAVRALERGDIPHIAKKRIQEHLNRQDKFFSSDLSVREFLLGKESGIEPISQVMGTCNFNVSYFGSYTGSYRSTGELTNITDAQFHGRRLALERMRREAELLGASGVIGVRIVSKPPDLGRRHSEFTAYGTAVHVPGYPQGAQPFTSDLNGQEFWQLLKAGYHPAGVAMGVCSYYIYSNWVARQQMYGTLGFGNAKNQEIDDYTWGFTAARDMAMSRLVVELSGLDADGIVGMKIDHDIEEIEYEANRTTYRDLLVNFVALGTAVRQVQVVPQASPLLCIDMRKGKNSSLVTLEEYSGL